MRKYISKIHDLNEHYKRDVLGNKQKVRNLQEEKTCNVLPKRNTVLILMKLVLATILENGIRYTQIINNVAVAKIYAIKSHFISYCY